VENITPFMEEILTVLKEKHKQMDNLMTFTKELEKVLGTGDPESFGRVLSMRQGSMTAIDTLNEEIKKILARMELPSGEKIKMLLEPEPLEELIDPNCPLENGIMDTNRMTLSLLNKIVKLDEEINKKIKGG